MTVRKEVAEALEGLQRLEPEDRFRFGCHPGVECFNACCHDQNLSLSPCDVVRLRRALGLPSRAFHERFTQVERGPGPGAPMVHLRMTGDESRACPLLGPQGCRVYAARPGACRTFPLGRGTRLGERDEVVEEWVLVRDEICRGFEGERVWTLGTWIADQELAPYHRIDDRYMTLLAGWQSAGVQLDRRGFTLAFQALYRVDAFARLIQAGNLLAKLAVPAERRDRILRDEEECLLFAIEWLGRAVR